MSDVGPAVTVCSNTVWPYRTVLRRHLHGFSETDLKWVKGEGWKTLRHEEWRTACDSRDG